MSAWRHLLVDEPAPGVRHLTLTLNEQLTQRAVHGAMEIIGMRAAIGAGTGIKALAFHRRASLEYRQERKQGPTRAPSHRDAPFGDHRPTSREETG